MGSTPEDVESAHPQLAGFVVRESSRLSSNFRAAGSLHDYLQRHGIVALAEIDTRALVRRIRTQGAMKGVLSSEDLDDRSLVHKAQASPGLVGRDLVREVMPSGSRAWQEGLSSWAHLDPPCAEPAAVDAAARRRAGFRDEVEHRTAPGRRRMPRVHCAWHADGR